MTRWWLGSIGGTTRPPTPHRFRPSLEGMDDRIVPDATPLVPPMFGAQTHAATLMTLAAGHRVVPQRPTLGTQADAATSTECVCAGTTSVSIDFTLYVDKEARIIAGQDTLTITIWNDGPDPTVVTVDVGQGSTPAAVAAVVADVLKNNGFPTATANGNIVTFNGDIALLKPR